MKVPFEVRSFDGQNVIFVNNELFDWARASKAIEKINQITDLIEIENIHYSVQSFFIESISCFLQKEITIKEVVESLRLGHIEL